MAAKNKCRKIFEVMKNKRLKNNFDSSGYKLKEKRYRMESTLDEIDRIAAIKKGLSDGYDLMSCTMSDMHIYLKDIPKNLAENLGYNIIYGIDGLMGDGVSKVEVDRLKEKYTPMIEKLVSDCDIVSNLILGNINLEYENLKQDQSETKDLVSRAFTLVDNIIIEAGI
jgi:hypothetical protein